MPTTLGDISGDTTPGRDLRVLMDVDEHIVTAPGEEITRTGHQIALGTVAGVGTSVNMLPRDEWWGLKSLQADASVLSEGTAADAGVMRAADFNLAPHHNEIPMSRFPSDIDGVGSPPAGVKAAGDWFIGHLIVAGQDTDFDILATDELLYPPPSITGPHIQMHRMAVARSTHAANTAYHLRMIVPGFVGSAPDNLLTFYFGGPYGGSNQGAFCVTLHGSGEAELRARIGNLITGDADPWQIVQRFRFAPPGAVAGRSHSLTIEPKGRDRIGITVGSSGAAQTHGRPSSTGPSFGSQTPDPHSARYSVNAFVGWAPGATVTGPGEVRVDVRQDLLLRWQVSRLLWPLSGQLIDHPSIFKNAPYNYVWLQVATKDYAGGSITPFLYYDNDTTALIAGDDMGGGLWRFNVGVPNIRRSFGVIYNFLSDGEGTPHLTKQTLFMSARTAESVGLKIPFTPNEVSVTGADGHPERASGGFVWEDLLGEGTLLRQRARIHSKIQVAYLEKVEAKTGTLGGSENVLISNLLDGEIAHCPGELKGTSDTPYPSPDWRRFEGSMVGVWARGHDQFNFTLLNYVQGGEDPVTHENRAPLVTDIIYNVFSQALGIPDNELDIPDVDIRLIPSDPGMYNDYMLWPKQIALDYVGKLAEDFLGYTVLRDDNAGYIDTSFSARGMWRLRPRTAFGAAHEPLWRFVFNPAPPQQPLPDPNPFPPPTGGGPSNPPSRIPGPVHDWYSYPPNTSFISRDKDGPHYRDWPEPPEFNYILVIAADDSTKLPDDVGQFKDYFPLANPKSYNPFPDNPTATDRTHPDFLGRFVPLVLIDRTLGAVRKEDGGTHGACMALAYALMDNLGHGRKRFRFRAPLPLVADPSDPLLVRRRPLRFDDPITVNGFPAIVSSCQPEGPLKTFNQWNWIEGVFQNGRWDGSNWVVDINGRPPM